MALLQQLSDFRVQGISDGDRDWRHCLIINPVLSKALAHMIWMLNLRYLDVYQSEHTRYSGDLLTLLRVEGTIWLRESKAGACAFFQTATDRFQKFR